MQGHRIELFLKCRQLKDKDTFTKSDPQVFIYLKYFDGHQIEQKWTFFEKTEMVKDNLNPNFEKSFILDFIFELKQPIKFEVKDIDGDQADDLGFAESTIGTLFGSRNQTCILQLNQGGKLITQIDKVKETQEFYTMKWSVRNLPKGCCSKPNPQLKFYKLKNQSELFIHETEKKGSTQNAIFNQLVLWAGKLSDPYAIHIMDNQKILGKVQIGLQEMNDRKTYDFQNGLLELEFFQSEIRPSFMDYLRGGLQINLSIAIDFTASNFDQQDPKSLHYMHGNNQYLQALRTVGEILLAYDYDKQVPCFGFGAQLDYPQLKSQQPIHCFPLSGVPENTNAVGLQGIEQLYEYSLQNILFGGPTYFAPILNETIKIATEIKNTEQNDVYLVFMILTDGIIHDMEETIQLLGIAQYLPMSIIIIGIGDEDFQLMRRLDDDNKLLGLKRDIVQFVPFREFNNSVLLAKEVLAELPDQVLSYMKMQGIKPKAPQEFVQI